MGINQTCSTFAVLFETDLEFSLEFLGLKLHALQLYSYVSCWMSVSLIILTFFICSYC